MQCIPVRVIYAMHTSEQLGSLSVTMHTNDQYHSADVNAMHTSEQPGSLSVTMHANFQLQSIPVNSFQNSHTKQVSNIHFLLTNSPITKSCDITYITAVCRSQLYRVFFFFFWLRLLENYHALFQFIYFSFSGLTFPHPLFFHIVIEGPFV